MTDARRLGALLLAALLLVGAAGLPLALLASPTPAAQHDATQRMPAWLRGAHLWAASAALVLVALHVAASLVAGRMRASGRRVPLVGLAILAVLLAVDFTGTILPWDQQAWEAYAHLQLGLAQTVPNDAGAAQLGLVFWAHVLALPILLAVGVAWHARRASWRQDLRRVWLLLDWRAGLALAAGVVALGALFAPKLGPPPLPGLEVARPGWPFLWLVPLQDWLGARALWILPGAFVVAGLLLLRKREPARRSALVALVVVALAWGALTVKGAL